VGRLVERGGERRGGWRLPIYEDGVLKPLEDPGLPEHHRFSEQVQELGEKPAEDELAAWHQVYAGLSDEDIAEVETIALDRSRFLRS